MTIDSTIFLAYNHEDSLPLSSFYFYDLLILIQAVVRFLVYNICLLVYKASHFIETKLTSTSCSYYQQPN